MRICSADTKYKRKMGTDRKPPRRDRFSPQRDGFPSLPQKLAPRIHDSQVTTGDAHNF